MHPISNGEPAKVVELHREALGERLGARQGI